MRNPDPEPFMAGRESMPVRLCDTSGRPNARRTNAVEPAPPTEVTRLLARARAGDAQALGAAYSAVYDELKRAARLQLRRMRDAFETTALVHEAYLKLAGGAQLAATDRNHLLALSARAMRQVLVDAARRRHAHKRGSSFTFVTLDEVSEAQQASAGELLTLDGALEDLARLHERQAQVVEFRFFGGLSLSEIAEVLQVSEATIDRDWRAARAWLARQLQPTR